MHIIISYLNLLSSFSELCPLEIAAPDVAKFLPVDDVLKSESPELHAIGIVGTRKKYLLGNYRKKNIFFY
jgi:hypothetical protein